jgi:hypothetical protein
MDRKRFGFVCLFVVWCLFILIGQDDTSARTQYKPNVPIPFLDRLQIRARLYDFLVELTILTFFYAIRFLFFLLNSIFNFVIARVATFQARLKQPEATQQNLP